MKDKVILVDGLNQIFRANVKWGKPGTNDQYTIVYNFFRNFRAQVESFRPHRIYFVLEGRAEFRYKLYPNYKANRLIKVGSKQEEDGDAFNKQKRIVLDLIKNLPITIARSPSYEGDDVIYTLVDNLKNEDLTIISSDSDFIQILQEFEKYDVKLYHPSKKLMIRAPTDFSYLVWKSLAGDVSDNIPAIMKDAEAVKIASSPKLLKDFLSSEENRANFSLNRDLISLHPVPHQELELEQFSFNPEPLKEAFESFDFKSMFKNSYWEKFVSTFGEVNG